MVKGGKKRKVMKDKSAAATLKLVGCVLRRRLVRLVTSLGSSALHGWKSQPQESSSIEKTDESQETGDTHSINDGTDGNTNQPDISDPNENDPEVKYHNSNDSEVMNPSESDAEDMETDSNDPGPSDPVYSEPGPSKFGYSELGPSNLGNSEPGLSEPGPSNRGNSNLGPSNLGNNDPGPSNLGNNDPGLSDPGPSNLGNSDPSSSNLGNSDPGLSDPGPSNLGNSNLGNHNPGYSDLGPSSLGNSDPGYNDPEPSSQDGDIDSKENIRVLMSKVLPEMSEGVDSNINNVRHDFANQTAAKRGPKKKKKKKSVKGKRLVARSIGRPKLKRGLRPRQMGSVHTKIKKLELQCRRLSKWKDEMTRKLLSSLAEEKDTSQAGSPRNETQALDQGLGDTHQTVRGAESDVKPTRQRKCTGRKAVDFIDFYQAGPSHSYSNREQRKGTVKTRKQGDPPKMAGRLNKSSSYTCLRHGSSESIEWPSLPGRSKGSIMETAKEIVKSKKSGSFTKMARKRWADVVTRRSSNDVTNREKQQPCLPDNSVVTRTWASVASNSGLPQMKTKVDEQPGTSGASPKPIKSEPMTSSGTPSKVKRKGKLDKHCSEGCKGKCKAQAMKLSSRIADDSLDKKLKLKAAKYRTKRAQAGDSSEESCRTSDHSPDCRHKKRGQNWCIDNMSVVYTRPVASVISLHSPCPTGHKQRRELNRCNNQQGPPNPGEFVTKVTTRSSTKEFLHKTNQDETNVDLCDRLSLISFQSSVESDQPCCSKTRPRPRDNGTARQRLTKPKRASTNQREASKSNTEDSEPNKQRKKVSERYRKLLRGESGRLDAKTVTELNTRSKRSETLEGDKEMTRAIQRKQRQERQQTSHDLQRSPTLVQDTSKRVLPVRTLAPKPGQSLKAAKKMAPSNKEPVSRERQQTSREPQKKADADHVIVKPRLTKKKAAVKDVGCEPSATEVSIIETGCMDIEPIDVDEIGLE